MSSEKLNILSNEEVEALKRALSEGDFVDWEDLYKRERRKNIELEEVIRSLKRIIDMNCCL